jgi:hypothetical protein
MMVMAAIIDDGDRDQRDSTTISSKMITATREIKGTYERGTNNKIREGKGRDNLTTCCTRTVVTMMCYGRTTGSRCR